MVRCGIKCIGRKGRTLTFDQNYFVYAPAIKMSTGADIKKLKRIKRAIQKLGVDDGALPRRNICIPSHFNLFRKGHKFRIKCSFILRNGQLFGILREDASEKCAILPDLIFIGLLLFNLVYFSNIYRHKTSKIFKISLYVYQNVENKNHVFPLICWKFFLKKKKNSKNEN